jgi:integrase
VKASPFVLPRFKDWNNGDQAVPLKTFLRSIKVRPIKFHALRACFATQMLASGIPSPIVMKIGGWKKSSTMDIYLRLSGVDTIKILHQNIFRFELPKTFILLII